MAAQKILRAALEYLEPTPAEKLLRAIETVYQQYGTPLTTDTTAIIREFRERDAWSYHGRQRRCEMAGAGRSLDRRLYEKPLPLQPKQEIVWVEDIEEWLGNL